MPTQTLIQIRCGFNGMSHGKTDAWFRLPSGKSVHIFWMQIPQIEPGLFKRMRWAYFGQEPVDLSIGELRALVRLRESQHVAANKN